MRIVIPLALTAIFAMGCTFSDTTTFPSMNIASNFEGSWSCIDDAGDSLNFGVTVEGNNQFITSTSTPMGVTCTETFTVSGTIATLISTSCNGPPPPTAALGATISLDAGINSPTYTSEDEGGPPQTLVCTVQQ